MMTKAAQTSRAGVKAPHAPGAGVCVLPVMALALTLAASGPALSQSQTRPQAQAQSSSQAQTPAQERQRRAAITDAAGERRPTTQGADDAGREQTTAGAVAPLAEEVIDPAAMAQPLPAEPLADPGTVPLEDVEPPRERADPTGIRLGTLRLRPSVTQRLETERRRAPGSERQRNTLSTAARAELESDWARHALTVTGETTLEKDVGGNNRRDGLQNATNIDARLRLDLADRTTGDLALGYRFAREDDDAPNSLGSAARQPGIHTITGTAGLSRELGRIHARAALELERNIHTDARLADGSIASMRDRDSTAIDGRLRLGYQISPAVIPFAEITFGRTLRDQNRDSAGYARSSRDFGANAGVTLDLGEKLGGEFSLGYAYSNPEDARLKALEALAVNGRLAWSPRRGTDIDIGLRSSLEASTAPGVSGWKEYELTARLSQELRRDLTANINAGVTRRLFPAGVSNQSLWVAGAGLAWSINPYLDLNADIEHEWTRRGNGLEKTLRAGMGLTLRR